MVHLSSPTAIAIAVFYSLLTFFIAPYIFYHYVPLTKRFNDPCLVGFILGFLLSITLWVLVGKNYIYKTR